MKVKVVACQQPLHEAVDVTAVRQHQPDFVCLPEHYPLAREITNLSEAAARFSQRKEYLRRLSADLDTVLIGGSITEAEVQGRGFYNTCYLFDHGREAGYYRKVHPTEREKAAGVLHGEEFKIFEVAGLRIAVLICADVLYLRSFEELRSLDCRIVFIPTASPFRPNESVEEKYERDRSIFLEGARMLGCPVVKTCGVGTTFGHPIQGRSLIATQEDILCRAEPHQENEGLMLFAELEL